MNIISVMIVDDSATVRQVLGGVIDQQADMKVIATAADPLFAMEKMKHLWPDVLVLDVEMPRMDGITFLRKLMAEHPTPVIICSTLTEKGTHTAIKALSAGAVGVVGKPVCGLKAFLETGSSELLREIRSAAKARLRQHGHHTGAAITSIPLSRVNKPVVPISKPGRTLEAKPELVAIGASTGGTQALEALLRPLPIGMPGIVVVQHMPEKFTAAFAERLNSVCQLTVKEARHGDRVLPGEVLIAPGGRHLVVRKRAGQCLVDVVDAPPVSRHRPSVDVLFRSVAESCGKSAVGIILTGMGDDGARGMKLMADYGCLTLAQDEASCVVFGMPKAAVALGAVTCSLSLEMMSHRLTQWQN